MSNDNFLYMAKTGAQRRERMRRALFADDASAKRDGREHSELKNFFQSIHDRVKRRSVGNADLLIPETLINMIDVDMQFAGGVSALVNQRHVGGTTRVLFSGDAPAAVWVECCDPIPKLEDLEFSMTELDCFKLAGYFAVCNATLDDAFINLAAHIQEQMTKSFKLALDHAVLLGKGSADKQPEGIIPALDAAHKVTSSAKFAEYLANYALLPDDAVVEAAVMTKRTYFEHFMKQTVQVTSGGRTVVANMQHPTLPDGTPVVFTRKDSGFMEDGQVLTGQFSKYLLVNRADMRIDKSEEVKFLEDQTVFRMIGRYDGKPLDAGYWLLITLTA